ncbi:hypothetical protein JYU34_022166 [Plutella xylostella]|uniref:Uncharacterized protein n=1 Tax=Plutella xylostella TaxID=51655 RepID=A0ABQ7PQD1_PLUXY|nr:hypothetical protein JYU34_022166 [Plutella xylostella]
MALAKAVLILVLIAATVADYDNEVESEAKKAVAAENAQTRSANPGKEKGAFQKLSLMLNRTEDGKRRRGKENLSKIFEMNRKHKSQSERHDHNDMLNDNEGAIISEAENDTNSLTIKMKELRKDLPPAYEAVNKYTVMPKITGVFCNFENSSQVDMCLWEWNTTVSNYGLGFKVATAADVERMNDSTSGLRFSGPSTDADGNVDGTFANDVFSPVKCYCV